MRYYKDRNQLTFDTIPKWHLHLTPKQVEALEKSWAGPFREFVTPNLPIKEISKIYSDSKGRPTKELYTIMGAVALQQIIDLTDDQTRDQLSYNKQWHYALDNFDLEDHDISEKSIWTMRQYLTEEGIAEKLFTHVTDDIIKKFNVDTKNQRLDSVHIYSNMAKMGRVTIMSRAITKFLKNLKRQHLDISTILASDFPDLIEHYYNENNKGYFGKVNPSKSSHRLIDIANDLYFLQQRYSIDRAVKNMRSYKIIVRIFSEQCRVEDGKVVTIPNKEISSSSIQNPSDLDAAYDGHKGRGYQTQLMETYQLPDEDVTDPQLNLITHVAVEPANCHDSHAVLPALEDVTDRDIAPDVLLADTAYGGDDNVEKAKAKDVKLVAPVPGNKKERDFSGFEFDDETDHVTSCPAGHEPDKFYHKKKTGKMIAVWVKDKCFVCSFSDGCITKKLKRGNRLNYTQKDLRLWRRRRIEDSKEFEDQYRYRAGVEASISRFIYQTGARRVKYRGLERVTFAQIMKALGLNIFRTAKYVKKAQIGLNKSYISFLTWLKSVYTAVKLNFSACTSCFSTKPGFSDILECQ